jgi:hypothetical protein
MLVKKNVAARNFTQVLSIFNDFLISRFDVSKATILFTTHVFTLDAFDHIFKLTHGNNALLKQEALISTTMACFSAYVSAFCSCVFSPSYFLGSYIPPNATTS